jgi:ribosomal protein S18 acetylase RimI-like enzyme
MHLHIRSALAGDEAATAALWRACGLVSGSKDPVADFRFATAGTESDVLLGIDAPGLIRGAVMVGHDGHRGWLYYVAADPAMRGTGIGRKMVEAALHWLRERGLDRAQLLVLDTNKDVLAFYQHLGFEVKPRIVMSISLRP